jgi:hypothetical protein
MKIRLFVPLLATLLALPALAADLTGVWVGTLTDPAGTPHDIALNLKADGQNVTGTITGAAPPEGSATPLQNGKFDGKQLSFELRVEPMPGASPIVIAFKGEVTGNKIKGTHLSPVGETPWEATKK